MRLRYIKELCRRHKLAFFFLFILTFIWINSSRKRSSSPNWQNNQTILADNYTKPVVAEVLLLYIYAASHPFAYGNLQYFLDTAVREGDGVDYYFILQQVHNQPINESEMPLLPKGNAYYVQHENKCYDFGTAGWFIEKFTYGNPWSNQTSNTTQNENRKLDLKRYKYFILMNSSIRGPFFTPYFIQLIAEANKNFHWHSVFTSRIDNNIKLVGCTISCETTPHVQTYFMATDFIGLSILLKPGSWGASREDGIFGCYPTKDHVSLYSEISSSTRILESGYLIDSLLTKYQKVNFSDPRNRFCNQNNNPYKDKNLEGTSVEPYEVVFVKYNHLEIQLDARRKAELIQRWVKDTTSMNRTVW